jgi:hypothetical protein
MAGTFQGCGCMLSITKCTQKRMYPLRDPGNRRASQVWRVAKKLKLWNDCLEAAACSSQWCPWTRQCGLQPSVPEPCYASSPGFGPGLGLQYKKPPMKQKYLDARSMSLQSLHCAINSSPIQQVRDGEKRMYITQRRLGGSSCTLAASSKALHLLQQMQKFV